MRNVRFLMLAMLLATAGACAFSVRPISGEIVYVHRDPPPPRSEERGRPPSDQHVWIAGHWLWRGDDFTWEPGRWVVIEQGHRHWVDGAWKHDRNGWYWVEGHWR